MLNRTTRSLPARWFVIVACLALTLLAGCNDSAKQAAAAKTEADKAAAAAATTAAAKALEDEAATLGVEAVVYGLPLVVMDVTRAKTTNVAQAGDFSAPVNQFANMPEFPDASFKDVVRANVDTLYSSAWLDLSKEPIVLSVPDTKGRYYLMPMLDAWTNIFASPGKRTTGTKAGNFAIVGPTWQGTLPSGMQELKSPTNMVWLIGRTQTNGPSDYTAVHAIQKQYRLTPLSAFGKSFAPPPAQVDPSVDMTTPPVQQVEKMDGGAFFTRLATLMKANPPPAADAPALAKLAKIGIVAGQDFDATKLDPAVARGIAHSVQTALAKLQEAAKGAGAAVNGWRVPPADLGNYGTDYGQRAVVALIGLGANLPTDAIYPSTFVDAAGAALSGANRYAMHFDKGQTPPTNAFWSLTMYNAQSFFAANPINRSAISSWMPVKYNKDGSLDIYVQKDSPGKTQEANWLPAADGDFSITMRIYWPKDEALDGTWKPSAVTVTK